MIYASTLVKALIIAAVIIVFIVISIINHKTKKPKVDENMDDCEGCISQHNCPIFLVSKNKQEENDQDNK